MKNHRIALALLSLALCLTLFAGCSNSAAKNERPLYVYFSDAR